MSSNRDFSDYIQQKQTRTLAFYQNNLELSDPLNLVLNRPKTTSVSLRTAVTIGRTTQLNLTQHLELASTNSQFTIVRNPFVYRLPPVAIVTGGGGSGPTGTLSGYLALDNNGRIITFTTDFTGGSNTGYTTQFTATLNATTFFYNGNYVLALENNDINVPTRDPPIRFSQSSNLQTWTTPVTPSVYSVINTKETIWDTDKWYLSAKAPSSPFQRFLTSTDGSTWTETSRSITILSGGYFPLSMAKNGNTIIIGFDSSTNSLWRSADNGVTFTNVSPSGVSIIAKIMYVNSTWYTYGAYASSFWKSTDDGITWTSAPFIDYVIWNAIYDGTKIIYENLSGYNFPGKGLLYSTNFGSNISACSGNDTIPDSSTYEYFGCVKRLFYNGPTYSWFNPSSGKAWKSSDGITWTQITHPDGGANSINYIFPLCLLSTTRTNG